MYLTSILCLFSRCLGVSIVEKFPMCLSLGGDVTLFQVKRKIFGTNAILVYAHKLVIVTELGFDV